jgi:hypothetical protein
MCKPIKRLAMIATVLAAAALPAASSARPALPDIEPYTVGAFTVQTPTPPLAHAAAARSTGFHWDDAVFGAAGMLALMGVGSGTVVAVRRRSARPVTS